jgi:hypothetical protein
VEPGGPIIKEDPTTPAELNDNAMAWGIDYFNISFLQFEIFPMLDISKFNSSGVVSHPFGS